ALSQLQPEHEGWADALLARYLEDGEREAASKLVEARAERADDPAAKANALVDLAQLLLADDQISQALSRLEEARDLDPTPPRVWIHLAEIADAGEGDEGAEARSRDAALAWAEASETGSAPAISLRAGERARDVLQDEDAARLHFERA